MPVRALSTPAPPIPIEDASQLLERRPDVAAAERAMANADALVGVQETAYSRTPDLTGSSGFESPAFATLLSTAPLFRALGASAIEIIFDDGLRCATAAPYTAKSTDDVAVYQRAVLTAI